MRSTAASACPRTVPSLGVPELSKSIGDWEAKRHSAVVTAMSLAGGRVAILITRNRDDLLAHDAELASAQLDIDEAEAILAKLTDDLRIAKLREAEGERQKRYDVAAKQLADMRKRLEENYPRLSAALIDLLTQEKAADDLCREVNADLPDGAQPLTSVEQPIRHIPATPDRTEMVKVKRIAPHALNRTGFHRDLDESHFIEREEPILVPGSGAIRPPQLYDTVVLPSLKPGQPLYRVPGSKAAEYLG